MAAPPIHPALPPDRLVALRRYEMLHAAWSEAEQAAIAAALGILDQELRGVAITPEEREEAGRLRALANERMLEALQARPDSWPANSDYS